MSTSYNMAENHKDRQFRITFETDDIGFYHRVRKAAASCVDRKTLGEYYIDLVSELAHNLRRLETLNQGLKNIVDDKYPTEKKPVIVNIKSDALCKKCAFNYDWCTARESCPGCPMYAGDCICLRISDGEICPYYEEGKPND